MSNSALLTLLFTLLVMTVLFTAFALGYAWGWWA